MASINNSEPAQDSPSATMRSQTSRADQRALMALAGFSLLSGLVIFTAWGRILPFAFLVWFVLTAFMGSVLLVTCRRRQRAVASSDPANRAHLEQKLLRAWRTPTSVGLLILGICFLNVLDGQLFTNSLAFLTFWTASLLIRMTDPVLGTSHGLARAWSLLVILLHVVLIAGVALLLPSNYVHQNRFNQRTVQMRKASEIRAREAVQERNEDR